MLAGDDHTTSSSTTTTEPAVWPLSGLGVEPRPALVVKVDNVDAEPQSGLNQADIVFEEIVEGRATRFAAVFNSIEANPVGPIRSARTQDVNLLLSLNDPAIAYSGANEEVNAALQAAGFELFGEGTPGFFRRDDLAGSAQPVRQRVGAVAADGQLRRRGADLRVRRPR